MAKRIPFFSVVIPTRNRPELIQYCLESLVVQTFGDFEVIVSDNHTGKPCKTVFDRFADERFKYVSPPSPLSMHDNWEFACSFSKGGYMTVLIDKTILRPSALQIVNTTLKEMPAEMVSWWNEGYIPFDEGCGYDKGQYKPSHTARNPYYFNPKEELERRFRLDNRRGTEGVHYYLGKICFGAFSQSLIRRIKEGIGRLFYPLSPDYTSMLAALAYTRSAVDIGQPLTMSIMTKVSNGRLVEMSDNYAFNFVKGIDPTLQILDKIPLKRLYTSSHNIVAADYLLMKEKVGDPMKSLILNRKNLILRAKEDLDRRVTWDNESRKKEHYALWNKYFSELSLQNRITIYLQMAKARILNTGYILNGSLRSMVVALPGMRKVKNVYSRWRFTFVAERRTYTNILEAAEYADKYYEKVLSSPFNESTEKV